MTRLLRIFISSPGDVDAERKRAALVIDKFAKVYARFFRIESCLWNTEPMLASGHFQDAIMPPGDADILVLILWSRLGTPLPQAKYRGIDGRAPVTGTEWEFETALSANRQRGVPDLLAYKKKAAPKAEYTSTADLEELGRQLQKLDVFWSRYFVDQGEFRAAFGEFTDLDGFEARLENDLRKLIERRIAALQGEKREATPATWREGSPFRGLESYKFEHAPIFFGRSEATKTAVELLTNNAEAGRPFLLVLGASGTGKSSLVQAGVVPALAARGVVPGIGGWRRCIVRPGGHPGGPFAALAAGLAGKDALPELLNGQDAAALAHHLEVAAADPSYPIVSALAAREQEGREKGDLLSFEKIRLVLVIDQLEELFTVADTSQERKEAFVRCLGALVLSRNVYVIATMRSDYWHRSADIPQLVQLAKGNGTFNLLPPVQDEILELISRSASVAGLTFESDPARDVRLDATLAAEAGAEPGSLPLLSCLLDELYKKDIKGTEACVLTYASARALGGLKGSIAKKAEAVFAALPADAQAALPRLLRALVTISAAGAEPTGLAIPKMRFVEGSPERQIVDRLLDPSARLLVADGDGEEARVRIAHEALLTHWSTAREFIVKHRADFELRARLEQAATLWRSTADDTRLLGEGTPLDEALSYLARYGDEVAPEIAAYIRASKAKWAGRPLERVDFFMGLALWFLFLGRIPSSVLSWLTIQEYGFSDATEIFIFISGYLTAQQCGPLLQERGLMVAMHRILSRVFQVYVAYIFLFALYVAAISYVAGSFDNPLYAEEMNVLDFMKQPDIALIQVLLLRYTPANMDVLQFYIPIMIFFAGYLWLLLRMPAIAMIASAVVYACMWVFDWNFPAYPNGAWVLNPLAWQLLFVFGAWCALGGAQELARWLNSPALLAGAGTYLLFAFAITMTWHVPRLAAYMPHTVSDMIYPIDKTNLDFFRLLHFFALAIVAIRLVPSDLQSALLRPVALCGRYPLELMCFGILLSFIGHLVMTEISDRLAAQFLVGLLGIGAMISLAMLLATFDRYRALYRAFPSAG